MNRQVKQSMAGHESAGDQGDGACARQRIHDGGKPESPSDSARQTVRDGVGVEIERSNDRVSRVNPNVLQAREQEDRPEQIDELGRKKQYRQRGVRHHALCGESNSNQNDR